MEIGDQGHAAHLIGRSEHVEAIERFTWIEHPLRMLVLVGAAGMGKTVLWKAGAEIARHRGYRVLTSHASDAESPLSFACITDLLDGVSGGELADLPPPQLMALNVVLHRANPSGPPPESIAISVGFLNALRILAARQPLMMCIDDAALVDEQSSAAVAFAARRLQDNRVRFLLTRRSGRSTGLERAVDVAALSHLEVGPLSFGAISHLVMERLGRAFPRRVLRRIFDTSGGNPLFALELGRTLMERGLPNIGSDLPMPDLLEKLFVARVTGLSAPVKRVVLAVALNPGVTRVELAQVADPVALDDAVAAGLVSTEGARVHASHPLLAAAAREASTNRERSELHRDLAEVVTDPTLRARHLAMATRAADCDLADQIATAAAVANARGAIHDAVELASHALRLTPPHDSERADRVLSLARYLSTAGEGAQVTALLTANLEGLPRGRARATAHLLMSYWVGLEDHAHNLERAMDESAGDPAIRAQVLVRMSAHESIDWVERLPHAEALAEEALALAPSDPDIERQALVALAWARILRGRPIGDLTRRMPKSVITSSLMDASFERPAGVGLAFRGDIAGARSAFLREQALADERGEALSGEALNLQLCELALRSGDVSEASRLLAEWDHWTSQGGGTLRSTKLRLRALLASLKGDGRLARRLAAEVVDDVGYGRMGPWDGLEASRADGIGALLQHDATAAVAALERVWEHTIREGVDDPGAFPVAGDLVEALLETGQLDAAREVTERLLRLAKDQDHPWGLATSSRCEGMIELVDGNDEGAAAAIAAAARAYDQLGLRFDGARSLLFLGRVQRRHKKRGPARRSLEAARAAFAELGCDGWAREATSELERISGRKSADDGALTESERRVAGLAAGGMSNKEIARQLFVTVYTVEAHLSHAYAKLGVRSRGQLARKIAALM